MLAGTVLTLINVAGTPISLGPNALIVGPSSVAYALPPLPLVAGQVTTLNGQSFHTLERYRNCRHNSNAKRISDHYIPHLDILRPIKPDNRYKFDTLKSAWTTAMELRTNNNPKWPNYF